jgi:PGAP1-like protein
MLFRGFAIALLFSLCGCTSAPPPVNPSFSVTPQAAHQVLIVSEEHPKPLTRPLVIVGGFLDLLGPPILTRDFEHYLNDPRIIEVSLSSAMSLDQCRQMIVDGVDRAYPTADPQQTIEVDVIGISMGGLAARYAAAPLPEPGHRRLNIARLFTISSPMRGAVLASDIPVILHPLQVPMRVDSAAIQSLDATSSWDDLYPTYSYEGLHDEYLGQGNGAVAGQTPWWVSTKPMMSPHMSAFLDERIRADIVRRLRGEKPLTSDPPAPFPKADNLNY